MAYVSVWVDDLVCECAHQCSGDCDRALEANDLEDRIAAAILALEAKGDFETVKILRGEIYAPKPLDLRDSYQLWKKGKLSGFAPPPAVIQQQNATP